MKRLLAGLLFLSLLGCSSGVHQRLPEVDHSLDGSWLVRSAELGGKPFAALIGFGLKINGNAYGVGVPPNYHDRGRLVMFGDELAGEPGRLDVVGEEGPNQGKRFPAIYRLLAGGRELEICYDLAGEERPRQFSSREGSKQLRVSYQRQ
jgi:uncharacterized protein (TIGR03067 family)